MAENAIAKVNSKELYNQTLDKVNAYRSEGRLSLPENYSAGNAIQSAQLVISEVVDRNKRPALEVCSKTSVAQALLDTVLQGLNPGKKQCYYIVYGDKLVMQRSWFGEVHLAKMLCPQIEGIYPDVVYKGDVFKYTKKHGRTVVTEHQQELGNIDKTAIVAAYCTIVYKDGTEDTTIMTIDEIHAAWRMSKQRPFDDKGNLTANSTHGQHPAEMAKKTVVRRACKPIINSSDDSNLIICESMRRTDDARMDAETDAIIYENNGADDVDFDEPVVEIDKTTGEVVETASEATPY